MDYLGEKHGTPIHLSERFSRFINHLGTNGGSVQANLPRLAEDLKLPMEAVRRIIKRAVEQKIVRVQTNGTYIGMGRAPNSYHLRIEWERWPELRATLAKEYQQKLDDAVRRSEQNRSRRRAEATIARRRRAAVNAPVRVWPPPPVPAAERLSTPGGSAPVEDLDVDAWYFAGDF